MLSIGIKKRFARRAGRILQLVFLAIAMPGVLLQATPCRAQAAGTVPPEAATGPVAAVAMPVMPATVVFESTAGNVTFPHNTHLGFGCAACHHQIHAEALDTPHPDYMTSSWIRCQGCHGANPAMPGPYYKCELCHHSEPSSISDETLSAKVVLHQSCWKCHESGTGVAASRGCGDCHAKEDQQLEESDG